MGGASLHHFDVRHLGRNKRHSSPLLALVLWLEQLEPLRPLVLLLVWLSTLFVVRLELEHLLRRWLGYKSLVGLGRSLSPLASISLPPPSPPHRSRSHWRPWLPRWRSYSRTLGWRQLLRLTQLRTSRRWQSARQGRSAASAITHRLDCKQRLNNLYSIPLAKHWLNLRTVISWSVKCSSGTEQLGGQRQRHFG